MLPNPTVEVASPVPSESPSPSPSRPESPSPTAARSASAPESSDTVPATGDGTFRIGNASSATAGDGTVLRYKVQVEDGIDLSADEVAQEVAAVLGNKRGWTADGIHGFQLVTSGSTDFEVKIATPGTVDYICGLYGLDTRGEVNCSGGTSVVVNLKRWMLGSPRFDGPLSEYRALIVNHEVGHRLGHGHLTCGGRGRLAPAMMQQIKGLNGCVANAWPYDEKGEYITGPSAN